MSNPLFKHINIYLTIDENTIDGFFNIHDPAPVYKRQLSQEFEEYIMNYVLAAKRYTTLQYKFNCPSESGQQYIDPLTHAIRRHFSIRKTLKEAEFRRFKKRSYQLLVVALIIGVICHWLLPALMPADGGHGFISAVKNSLDVLSWVTLWRPIDKLIFQWNPFLKEILMLDKLTSAEVQVISNVKKMPIEHAA